MRFPVPDSVPVHLRHLLPAARHMAGLQQKTGALPWFEAGPWDPWNHVEAAMALTACGAVEAARQAYDYLASCQRPDGAWLGEYGNALPMSDRDHISREPAPAFLDSNFCAYPATGILHYYLSTGDVKKVRQWWPMIEAALDFVLSLQRPDGAVIWAFEALGTEQEDALLAGNASIAKSLDCGLYLARRLGQVKPAWQQAYQALAQALRTSPDVFDRRGTGARFAMDWYYPILSGVLDERQAQARLHAGWSRFVEHQKGCRCVADEPWITVAESCELAMALLYLGDTYRAAELLSQVQTVKDDQGVFWMGWQYEENQVWPRERPAWTQAAIILATDALHGSHPSSQLLVRRISETTQQA